MTKRKKKYNYSFGIGELFFIALPIIFIAVIELRNEGRFWFMPYKKEWALAGIILFGQSIMKLFYSIGENNSESKRYNTGALIGAIFTLGLFPCSTFYVIHLIDIEPRFPNWVFWLIILLFIIGCFTYIFANRKEISAEK